MTASQSSSKQIFNRCLNYAVHEKIHDMQSFSILLNDSFILTSSVFGLQSWEKKKVQSQVVFERDNTYASRPGTSSRRLPNRSLNGSLDYSPPMNKRLPMGIQQLGSNNISSGNQGISFIKDGRKIQRKTIFDEPTFTFHMQDEASSIMSTHSGPFSP